jgi:hypothetical protein
MCDSGIPMLLLVTESPLSCSSGGLFEDVFAVRLIHTTAVLDSLLLLLLSRGQLLLLLLLLGFMPSSPVGRIRFMLLKICVIMQVGDRDACRQVASARPRSIAGNPEFPFLSLYLKSYQRF